MSVESFLFLRLSPPGNRWSDVLGQQVVSQAPQHLKSSETKATCDGYFACRSVCSVMTPACPGQHVHRVFEEGCQTLIHAILGFPHAILSLGFPHAILLFPHTILGLGFPHAILGLGFPHAILGFPHAILGLGFPHAILGFPHAILGFPFPCSLFFVTPSFCGGQKIRRK